MRVKTFSLFIALFIRDDLLGFSVHLIQFTYLLTVPILWKPIRVINIGVSEFHDWGVRVSRLGCRFQYRDVAFNIGVSRFQYRGVAISISGCRDFNIGVSRFQYRGVAISILGCRDFNIRGVRVSRFDTSI